MFPGECSCSDKYEEKSDSDCNCIPKKKSVSKCRRSSDLKDFIDEIGQLKCKVVNLTRKQIEKSKNNQADLRSELKEDSGDFDFCDYSGDGDESLHTSNQSNQGIDPDTPRRLTRGKMRDSHFSERDYPGQEDPTNIEGMDPTSPGSMDPTDPTNTEGTDPTDLGDGSQRESKSTITDSAYQSLYDELLSYRPSKTFLLFILFMILLLAVLFVLFAILSTRLCSRGGFCLPLSIYRISRPRVY